MSAVSYSRSRIACILAVLVTVVAAAPAAQARGPKFKKPRGVYLALGDSLAFGYQEAKELAGLPNPSPSLFDTGYVDDFAAGFGATYPGVETVNLGCPGETTDTLISATNATTGCTTYPFGIHVNHRGMT